MDYHLFHTICVIVMFAASSQAELTITCADETFQAKCPMGKIVINDAKYGLMNIGRCVKVDLGYIGCASTVTGYLTSQCADQQQCSITVPNPELDQMQGCPKDLIQFLEVDYECVQENNGGSNLKSCITLVSILLASLHVLML